MIKQLLEEVRQRAARRAPAASGSRRSTTPRSRELAARPVARPAGRARPAGASRSTTGRPSDAELRIAQAQLVGWLEGLFHGIQATLFAQQMAARQQLEQMRSGLPHGPRTPAGAGRASWCLSVDFHRSGTHRAGLRSNPETTGLFRIMAIEVETKDCTALSDAELEEMADICADGTRALRHRLLSKQRDDWVLVTRADDGNRLQGYSFCTLERIGGTPCVLIGLALGEAHRASARRCCGR